jgi:hypothetical protein
MAIEHRAFVDNELCCANISFDHRFSFKHKQVDVREIGKRLNAATVSKEAHKEQATGCAS